MTAIIDTGPLVALVLERDAYHERARGLLRRAFEGEWGTPLTSDLVLLEGLTLLQARWGDRRASQAFATLFHGAKDSFGPVLRVRHAGADLVERAIELHFRFYDRRLSTVDCALIAMAEDAQGVVVSFDQGLAGVVPVVSE